MSEKKLITMICSVVAVISVLVAVLVITNNVKYTITFNSDGGTLVKEQIVKKGTKVTKPKDPIKEGYKFISWTYQNETYNFSLKVTSDMELKAKWYEVKEEVKEYIVKFNTDGGATIENQIVEERNKVLKPESPTKEGYTFKGWYLNDKEYDFETEVTKDIELDAKWEKIKVPENNGSNNNNNNNNNKPTSPSIKKYTVTFNTNDGSDVPSQTVEEGKKIKQPTTPTKDGSLFIEWILNGKKYNFDEKVNKDITLTANWLLLGDVNSDERVDTLDIIMITKYAHGIENPADYNIKAGDVNLDGVVDDVDASILAKYIVDAEGYGIKLPYNSGNKYTISYNLNGGVLMSYILTYAEVSLPYTLIEPEKEGYAFIGWTGSNGNTPQLDVKILSGTTGNLTYTANWVQYGNVLEDDQINAGDLSLIKAHIDGLKQLTEKQKLVADVNLDGVVDDKDLDVLAKYISGGFGIDKLPYTQ